MEKETRKEKYGSRGWKLHTKKILSLCINLSSCFNSTQYRRINNNNNKGIGGAGDAVKIG